MGHMLHARAGTTPEVRREIQNSQESLNTLAKRYGINPKTVQKWRKREFVHDAPMGPKIIRSRSLSQLEEAAVVAFRVFTQLPLDDCLYSLQDSIPHLTRSSLHRCLQRHGRTGIMLRAIVYVANSGYTFSINKNCTRTCDYSAAMTSRITKPRNRFFCHRFSLPYSECP